MDMPLVFLSIIEEHKAGNPEDEQENWTYLNQEEIVDLMRSEGVTVSR